MLASRKIYWTMGKTSATNRMSTSLGRSILYIPTFVTIPSHLLKVLSRCKCKPKKCWSLCKDMVSSPWHNQRWQVCDFGPGLRMVLEFRGLHRFWKGGGQTNINTAKGYKTCGEPQIKECWHQLWTIGLGSYSSCLLSFDRALFMPHSISSTCSENAMKDKNILTSLWPIKSVPRIW